MFFSTGRCRNKKKSTFLPQCVCVKALSGVCSGREKVGQVLLQTSFFFLTVSKRFRENNLKKKMSYVTNEPVGFMRVSLTNRAEA